MVPLLWLCMLGLLHQTVAFRVRPDFSRTSRRFVRAARMAPTASSDGVEDLSPLVFARASALHDTLVALRRELPLTVFSAGTPELYTDDVQLIAETGEVLVEVVLQRLYT